MNLTIYVPLFLCMLDTNFGQANPCSFTDDAENVYMLSKPRCMTHDDRTKTDLNRSPDDLVDLKMLQGTKKFQIYFFLNTKRRSKHFKLTVWIPFL